MNAITQPGDYSAGYSALPLRLSSFGATNSNEYKYLVNITWDKSLKQSVTSASFNNYVYTAITTTEVHSFETGQIVLIDDSINGNDKTGYYTIMNVPSSNQIIIDLVPGTPWGAGASTISRVIKYKMSPDLEGEAKLDLSNTIKDFVTQNLKDINETYEAPNTKFTYDVSVGSESKFIHTFDDNFAAGSVAFNQFGNFVTSSVPFDVGDAILVEQDIVGIPYDDNFFAGGGYVGFTGSSPHNFRVGQQITIEGQITYPYYNGPSTITEVGSTWIKTDKQFIGNSPAEPGVMWGVPRPEYNGVFTITEIYVDLTYGLIIDTNNSFTDSSLPIPGTIRFADDRLTTTTNELVISDKEAYNSRTHRLDYSIDYFDKYVCQVRTSEANNISTILEGTNKFVIEQSTKSWLLAHQYDVTERQFSPRFVFYDKNNTEQATYELAMSYEYGPNVLINSYTDNGGDLQINLNSAHNMSVGDFLEVIGAYAPYNGTWLVIEINSSTQLTVSNPYVANVLNGGEYLRQITNPYQEDYYFPVGIDQLLLSNNFTLFTGTDLQTLLDAGDVDYYEVYLQRLGSRGTNSILYNLNDDCSYYEVYHLMWKDEKGSWLSYPFIYISKDFTEVERKQYYKTEGNWDNDTFGYDSYGRGEQTYFSRSRDKVLLNSGWVKEYENDLIKDLMTSASVFVQKPDGTLVGAQIENKELELKKELTDKIFNYTFNVRLSSNEYRF
jgi:hypothetical protein